MSRGVAAVVRCQSSSRMGLCRSRLGGRQKLGCLPDSCADRSVIDVAGHPTLVKGHDLHRAESAPSRPGFGVSAPPICGGHEREETNGIDFPLPHVVMHDALDELGIPPDFGVVLQLRMVQGDAPLGVYAEGIARALELLQPRFANAVVVACWAVSSQHSATCQDAHPST